MGFKTGVTEAHVSSIVNCQKAISVSYAKTRIRLGIDAGFWINLQANYDKELADLKRSMKFPMRNLTYLKVKKDCGVS